MSPLVKGTSRADTLCIEGVCACGGGGEVCGSPRDAVSARAGCEGSVALLVLEPTPNARRLRLSAIIYAGSAASSAVSALHWWNRGGGQRTETAGAEQNRG